MAGLGKYKKGAKFTLKSGNTPLFKYMGESPSPITSPANMNDFGVGKGTSPYKVIPPPPGGDSEEADGDKKMGGWKKAAGAALSGLAGGLNAVYGSKIPSPKNSDRLKKEAKAITDKSDGELFGDTETPEQKKRRLAEEAEKNK